MDYLELTTVRRKRTDAQIDLDRRFIYWLITEDHSISSISVTKALNEHIAHRGDSYTLDYTYIQKEMFKARKDIFGYLDFDKEQRAKEVHQRIQDNILIASEQVYQTLQLRQEENIEIEEIGVKDLEGISLQQIAFLESFKKEFYKRKIKIRKLLPGHGLYEAMITLAMWIKAERDLLGLDAPKRIEKKTEKQIRKETFDYTTFEVKMKELGYDATSIIKLLQPIKNG